MATIPQQPQPEDATNPAQIRLRAIIFQRGEWWVGACLERAIGSQARTREALIADLERMVRFYLERAEDREEAEPFAALPKAPNAFWRRYDSGDGERLSVVIRATSATAATVELQAA